VQRTVQMDGWMQQHYSSRERPTVNHGKMQTRSMRGLEHQLFSIQDGHETTRQAFGLMESHRLLRIR